MIPERGRTFSIWIGQRGPVSQWIALIVLSIGLGGFLLWAHAPAALLLGPLLAGVTFAAAGGKVPFPLPVFVIAQGIVGCMIAKMVPLTIVGDILNHWLLFTLGVLLVVAASTFIGWLMTRLRMMPGTTALWGCSPGAASVMTLMAESYGADVRLVAFMQYLRIVMVAGIAALVAKVFGVSTTHGATTIVWFSGIAWLSLAETLALAIVGPLIARRLRIPASYALVGWNIGLRFTRPLLVHALRSLPQILTGSLALIVLCGGVAVFLVFAAGVDPLTAYLATSPGGSDSIAIIAASSNVDISFVMAMQTVRMIAVLFIGPSLTKFIVRRIGVQ